MRNTLLNQKGFSLLELVLVISLIGIMAFTAVPILMDNQVYNLDGATRKLENELRYAQNLAMTTGESYGFRTTGQGGAGTNTAYEIYQVSTNAAIESPYHHLAMEEDLNTSFPGVTFSNQHDVVFDTEGTPSFPQGNGQIQMSGSGNQQSTVQINAIGLIQVVKN